MVRDMMRRLLAGQSAGEIRKLLAGRGVTTTAGNQFTTATVTRILTSARIAGWRGVPTPRSSLSYYGADFLVKAQWRGIVSRADVDRARTILSDETLRAGSSRRWLLSGIALCSACGRPLMSSYKTRLYVVTAATAPSACPIVAGSRRLPGDSRSTYADGSRCRQRRPLKSNS